MKRLIRFFPASASPEGGRFSSGRRAQSFITTRSAKRRLIGRRRGVARRRASVTRRFFARPPSQRRNRLQRSRYLFPSGAIGASHQTDVIESLRSVGVAPAGSTSLKSSGEQPTTFVESFKVKLSNARQLFTFYLN